MDGGRILEAFGLRLAPKEAIAAALRTGAQGSSACIAYGFLALCWIFLFARAQRLAGFDAAIQALPELQRAQLLKQAYPSFAGTGLSSQAFIQRRQRNTWLIAFVALVVAASVVAVTALASLPARS
jgi:cobalamin synthase